MDGLHFITGPVAQPTTVERVDGFSVPARVMSAMRVGSDKMFLVSFECSVKSIAPNDHMATNQQSSAVTEQIPSINLREFAYPR